MRLFCLASAVFAALALSEASAAWVQLADCSGVVAAGAGCWDTDDEVLSVGDGIQAVPIGSGDAIPASIALNTPIDADGDTEPDLIFCDGDYDGNLQVEVDDVQACIGALADAGDRFAVLLPGNYVFPGSPPAGNTLGAVELVSNLAFQCQEGSVLFGPGLSVPDPQGQLAVLHTFGASNLLVRNCELTEGLPSSYDATGLSGARNGLRVFQTLGFRGEDLHVHDILHACIYLRESEDVILTNVLLEDCGGYGDTSGTFQQPCSYIFGPSGGLDSRNVSIGPGSYRRCGHAGFNTRRGHPSAQLLGIHGHDLIIEDVGPGPTGGGACFDFAGVDGGSAVDSSCVRAGSLVGLNGQGFYSDGGWLSVDSVRYIALSGLQGSQLRGPGIHVSRALEDVTGSDITISGTGEGSPCMLHRGGWRRVDWSDLTFEDCGEGGIVDEPVIGGNTPSSVDVSFVGVSIDNAVAFRGSQSFLISAAVFDGNWTDLWIQDWTVRGFTDDGLEFRGRLVDSTLDLLDIDYLDDGYGGSSTVANLPACDGAAIHQWRIVTDAVGQGDCSVGGSSHEAICRCTGSRWNSLQYRGDERPDGVHVAGVGSDNVSILNATVRNLVRDGYGILIGSSPTNVDLDGVTAIDTKGTYLFDGAVEVEFGGATHTIANTQCTGTEVGEPCVELNPPPVCPSGNDDLDMYCNVDDNCTQVFNDQCDTNSDGYGNACDGDYNESGAVGLVPDFSEFTAAFGAGVGPEQDSNCDGLVGLVPDFQDFLTQFRSGTPGPSGLACAGSGEGACPPGP
jgi:hypothetical protein